jgi:F-type H+-transporting ATPase subunit b
LKRSLVLVAVLLVATVATAAASGGMLLQGHEGEEAHGSPLDLVFRVVNFAILAGALVYLLRKPLSNYLNAKAEQIRSDLAAAVGKRERAEAERKEAEARLAGLDEEIAAVRAKGLAQAEDERRRILQAAESEAARLAERAKKDIEAEVELARRRLTARAAELSVELARKKLAEQIGDADRQALFDKGLEKLGDAKR